MIGTGGRWLSLGVLLLIVITRHEGCWSFRPEVGWAVFMRIPVQQRSLNAFGSVVRQAWKCCSCSTVGWVRFMPIMCAEQERFVYGRG